MDPWLEHPALWPGVHNALIAAVQRWLSPRLRPHYVVRMQERAYLDVDASWVGLPDLSVQSAAARSGRRAASKTVAAPGAVLDVEIPMPDQVRETWLEIRAPRHGDVVTVVEILSPGNKRPGDGRRLYEEKRRQILGSRTHLIEIDLLRGGMAMPVHGPRHGAHYRILVSRGDQRPRAQLYPFTVRDAIPAFPLPLAGGCEEPQITLRPLLDGVYETSGFDLELDYRQAPVPALSSADATWAARLTRSRRRK